MTRNHIRQALDVIFDQIFNQGQADLLPGLVSGPYIQHNPLFPNGLDGIMGYIKQAGRIPCEVKRIAIDGDLAFIHVRYLDWGGQETAGVDIFRFDADGKIVEHWDVLQPVPAASKQRQHDVLISTPAGIRRHGGLCQRPEGGPSGPSKSTWCPRRAAPWASITAEPLKAVLNGRRLLQ
ncbi:MAG TPA: nuclear transport factor 2 family protein [Bryobacteraceae bacterium]|nr:nuclear transport factor 2 family protein [Bryobacteraceae bacterium]